MRTYHDPSGPGGMPMAPPGYPQATSSVSTDSAHPPDVDSLLDIVSAGVVVHGADSRAFYANRYALALLGPALDIMRTEPVSSNAWPLLRADGSPLPPAENPVQRVLASGATVVDFVIGLRGPVTRWLLCSAHPTFAPGGRIEEVVVCFTDCTELKRMEQSLRDSKERLRLMLQGSTDAPWDWNLAEPRPYLSARWWDMLGYSRSDPAADDNGWYALVHPEDLPRLREYMQQVVTSGESVYRIEFRMRHRAGHDVPVLSRGFVQRDSTGKALRLSGTNTDLTDAKHAEQRIYELAYFDVLTGLPNRRLLHEQMAKILPRSARSRQVGALLFIDLDNFKLLNDTLGHDVGDHLLRLVAGRLRDTVRASDHLARLGGDEFVVVLENLGETEDAAVHETQAIGAKLLAALGQPYSLGVRLHSSTPSIGVALFGAQPTSADLLLRQADLAMYRAKGDGRNTLRFFDPGMQAAADQQIDLQNDLRDGIRQQHFELYCQPQFGADGRLVGGEVLVRWRHDVRGLVVPGDFISLAEASGLIVPLGAMVLAEACRVLARWALDPRLETLTMAVNVSAYQLREPDFVEGVLDTLARSGANPRRLCLELTESVFAENVDAVSDKMRALRAHGIRFSLDDFGTGYSSLSYLKRFPLAELKIDRSFVKDLPGDAHAGAIVEAILALARTLDLEVVAEGVETGAQRDFLVARGCRVFQGYLLGKPLPIAGFEAGFATA